jgi:aminopeptidase
MTETEFDQILEKYARLIVRVGLNLQPSQGLTVAAVPLEVAPLVRKVAEQAYLLGCRFVDVQWFDEGLDLVRFQNAPGDSFEEYPTWVSQGRLQNLERGDAYLQVWGQDPALFKDVDQGLLDTYNRARARHLKPVRSFPLNNTVQWLFVSPPTPAWASRVFPGRSSSEALDELWQSVIRVCRLDLPDPIAFWKGYLDEMMARADALTERAYRKLIFRGPGTELEVGLPEGHLWVGGWDHTPSGIQFCGNLPTEEVYTLPHRERVNGTVKASKPLSYEGKMVEDFSLTFREGKVVDVTARTGEETLRGILETDPSSAFLGEVALVPHSTPISQFGLVFLNTLYDENASNHLALGSAYRVTLRGGSEMSSEEFAAAGGNESLVHEDFMFGCAEMDVDGVSSGNKKDAVMRGGEWAFDI